EVSYEQFESIKTPFNQCIEKVLTHISLDEHFITFYEWCTSVSVPIVILSGGLTQTIQALLTTSIGHELRGIEIIANSVVVRNNFRSVNDEGGAWRVQFHDDSVFGHDKASTIRPYANLREGMPEHEKPILLYAGDGVSDISAAKEADLLFAKQGEESRRTSLDTPFPRSRGNSPALGPPQRRNKAALRDYYGLKGAAPADASDGSQHEEAEVRISELDAEGFDAEAYVKGLLAREGLAGLLKIEGGLINDIRSLDGEKKALVYDNYSKLITATDTIRKMRTNMDPLTPTTSTLSPAISHIAETASSLASSLQGQTSDIGGTSVAPEFREAKRTKQQQATVRWVAATPNRLRQLFLSGRGDEAVQDWNEIEKLLGKWDGVPGVQELKSECFQIMEEYPKMSRSGSNF
ncbi:MAG: hypothetical protein Q9214_002417, partial [Letrouitia sp. 1 TL-2023]